MTRKAWLALVPALAVSLPAMADSSMVSMQDIHFTPLESSTLIAKKNAIGQKPFVLVSGVGTAVRLVPGATVQPKNELAFGIRHVDDGTHGFTFAFDTGSGEAVVSFQCDLLPGIQDNGLTPAPDNVSKKYTPVTVDEELPGSAVVTAKFSDAKTFSLKVTRKGIVLHEMNGLSGPFTIPDFEGKEEQRKTETLKVRLVYGIERDDAWSLVLRHENHVVTITPDAAQAFNGLPKVSLRTTGLDQVELVGVKAG